MNELTWLYLNDEKIRAAINGAVLFAEGVDINPLLIAEHPCGDFCPIGGRSEVDGATMEVELP